MRAFDFAVIQRNVQVAVVVIAAVGLDISFQSRNAWVQLQYVVGINNIFAVVARYWRACWQWSIVAECAYRDAEVTFAECPANIDILSYQVPMLYKQHHNSCLYFAMSYSFSGIDITTS